MATHRTTALALVLSLAALLAMLAIPWNGESAPVARVASGPGPSIAAWRRAGAAERSELLTAAAERGDPAGLELLAWVATFDLAGHELEVARALLQLAPRARSGDERKPLADLCVLLETSDSACVQIASQALSRARVEAAVPYWIELLSSASRAVRERAQRSLEAVSGMALGSGPERWLRWHESELAWFELQAPRVLAELGDEDETKVLAAMREIAGRHLFRDELADALIVALDRPESDVRICACRTLAGLGSPLAVKPLVALLEDENQAVRSAALSALRALTGLELPLDAKAWNEALGIGMGVAGNA